jgi:hypothetical protein
LLSTHENISMFGKTICVAFSKDRHSFAPPSTWEIGAQVLGLDESTTTATNTHTINQFGSLSWLSFGWTRMDFTIRCHLLNHS